jgi:glycine betaine/proline transport system substrate-binding protein
MLPPVSADTPESPDSMNPRVAYPGNNALMHRVRSRAATTQRNYFTHLEEKRMSSPTKTLLNGILASAIMLLLCSTPVNAQEKQWPESREPIKISLINYSVQNVLSYIYGTVLERIGYNVEYVSADYIGQFEGIANGDIDVGIDMWETTTRIQLAEYVQSGKVKNMGTQAGPIWETWWYPDYLEESCPGLPDWKALLEPACVEALATPETTPKGRLITGPKEWNLKDEERIEALGLQFEAIHAGGDAALMAEMTSSIKRKEPFIGFAWFPHWFVAKHGKTWVEFPAYEPACYTDPAWGVNPNATVDCEMPTGFTWKVAWAGGEVMWPKAYKILRVFRIDHDTNGKLAARTDLDKIPAAEVAKEWVDSNEDVWRQWLK